MLVSSNCWTIGTWIPARSRDPVRSGTPHAGLVIWDFLASRFTPAESKGGETLVSILGHGGGHAVRQPILMLPTLAFRPIKQRGRLTANPSVSSEGDKLLELFEAGFP